MEGQIPRTKVRAARGKAAVRNEVLDHSVESGDVVLRLLHTADWHLGRRFPSFPEEAQKKLSRARMEVIPRILDVAQRHSVNAVVCAGDLFDDPEPQTDCWQELAKKFRERGASHPPVFLVPGNHDPSTPDS